MLLKDSPHYALLNMPDNAGCTRKKKITTNTRNIKKSSRYQQHLGESTNTLLTPLVDFFKYYLNFISIKKIEVIYLGCS